MRLIDADALVEAMTKFSDATGEDMTHGIFYTHIAPTIDAVPVEFIRSEMKYTEGFYNNSLRILLDTWTARKEDDRHI